MIRQRITGVALFLTLLLSIAPFSTQAAGTTGDIKVVVNNTMLTFDVPAQLVHDRTLVPFRHISEALGADVQWIGETNTVVVTKENINIKMVINSDTAYINNQPVKMDVPATLIDNRTLVPLRFVGEALKATVGWDQDKKWAIIDTADLSKAVSVTVTRVVDGDTVEVSNNGLTDKVRIIGVDTPETKDPNKPVMAYGPEASAYTKSRLEGQQVYIVPGTEQRDRYGRLLAYIYMSDLKFFNAELAAQGFARAMTIKPNNVHANLLIALVKGAKSAKTGLWSGPDPWDGDDGIDVEGHPVAVEGDSVGGSQQPITGGQTGNVVIDSLDLSGEVVVVHNMDSKDIDLTGWKLVSTEGNQTYNFPTGFVLGTGESVKIVSGRNATNNPPNQLLWTTSYIWNNAGDTAVLYDANGQELSRK